MLGVDTNVLVRFLTRDEPNQAEQSRLLLTARQNQPIHVGLVVLMELVWVLTKVKRWPSRDVFAACRGLLQSDDFVVEEAEMLEQCLLAAERARCDLADAVIAAMNARAGCRDTATFDHRAKGLAGMSPVEAFI